MKKFLTVGFAAVAAVTAARAVEVDAIAARVNSAVILKSDVLGEMRRVGAEPSQYDEVRGALVERELMLKAAKDSKMTMQEWVVENRLREIINQAFGGDRNKLMDTLAKQRVSYPEWRQRMMDDMIVGAMRWQIIDKNCSASPTAMREEYEKHPERYDIKERMTVSVILLKPEDAAKRDEVGELLKKEDFAAIARRYSADSHAAEGGVWKDVEPADVFRPEVCEELKKMPRGTISRWIELDGWSFLLRKDGESAARKRSFAEAYDDIEANVKEEMAKKLHKDWLDRLKAESYIKLY